LQIDAGLYSENRRAYTARPAALERGDFSCFDLDNAAGISAPRRITCSGRMQCIDAKCVERSFPLARLRFKSLSKPAANPIRSVLKRMGSSKSKQVRSLKQAAGNHGMIQVDKDEKL